MISVYTMCHDISIISKYHLKSEGFMPVKLLL